MRPGGTGCTSATCSAAASTAGRPTAVDAGGAEAARRRRHVPARGRRRGRHRARRAARRGTASAGAARPRGRDRLQRPRHRPRTARLSSARCGSIRSRASAGPGRDLADRRGRRLGAGRRRGRLAERDRRSRPTAPPSYVCDYAHERVLACDLDATAALIAACSPSAGRFGGRAGGGRRGRGVGRDSARRRRSRASTPDGALERESGRPGGFVTSLCFGGDDMRDLYIRPTTADSDGRCVRGPLRRRRALAGLPRRRLRRRLEARAAPE